MTHFIRTAVAALAALSLPAAALANDLAVPVGAQPAYQGDAVPYDATAGPLIVKSYGMPAPLAEQPGMQPFPGAVWVSGYWFDKALSQKWEWVPGYWAAPAPKAVVVRRAVVRPVVRPAFVYRPNVRVVWRPGRR